MKVIRQTIRESVRKLPIPPYRPGDPVSPHHLAAPDAVHNHHVSSPQLQTLQNRRPAKGPDAERHSMDFDEKVGKIDYENMRTRSKTVGDLNQASLEDNTAFPAAAETKPSSKRGSPCSSMSNLSNSSHSGSAKLQYASANPMNYSTGSVNSGGSPIWKPRSEVLKVGTVSLAVSQEDNNSNGSSSSGKESAESEPQSFQTQTKTIVFANFENKNALKDTEC